MSPQAPPTSPRSRVRAILQISLRRLMVYVAVVAVLFSAWLYNRENGNAQRSWASIQLRALDQGGPAERRVAAENLYDIDVDDLARVILALAGALRDPAWEVRRGAAGSLGNAIERGNAARKVALVEEIDFAARALIPALSDTRDEVRFEAVRSLGKLYRTPWVSSTAPGRRVAASGFGSEDSRVIAALLQAMHDPVARIRVQAVESLLQIGPAAGMDAGPIKEAIESDPAVEVRSAAIRALVAGWGDDDGVYPLLLPRLKDTTSPMERFAAGWVIGSPNLPPPPVEALPVLIEVLSTDDFSSRSSILLALQKLGPMARSALPTLARIAREQFTDGRGWPPTALEAIIAIDPDSAEAQKLLEPLVARLRSSPGIRRQGLGVAIEAFGPAAVLAKFGPSAAPVVPSLREALKGETTGVRWGAIHVLDRIGPAAQPAAPELAALARDDPDDEIRRYAAQVLGKIDAYTELLEDAVPE